MSGTFRIRFPKPIETETPEILLNEGEGLRSMTDGNKATGAQAPSNDYLQRLIKLIPAEVLGIYLAIRNATANDSGEINIADNYIWLPIVGLGLVLFARIVGTNIITKKTVKGKTVTKWDIEWPLVAISGISFIIWVYAMGDGPIFNSYPDNVMIAAAVSIWTFAVPYFYKSSEASN